MNLPLKPIYLLADSQLLFWRRGEFLFLESVRVLLERESPKAAYIGASNDDQPEYYSIFEAAMESIGIRDCRMVLSSPSTDDISYLENADLILLAGGDMEKGWRALEDSSLTELIVKRYYEGAFLMGISAGAAQLGLLGWPEGNPSPEMLINPFGLVPFVVSAHEEKDEWKSLRKVLQTTDRNMTGIGIPTGGGVIYHADHSLEPVRRPLHEFSIKEGQLIHNLLFPDVDDNIQEVMEVC